jgi:hypothetical protein
VLDIDIYVHYISKDGRNEGRKGYVCTVAVTILFLATGIHGEIGPGPSGWYIHTYCQCRLGEGELDAHAQNII